MQRLSQSAFIRSPIGGYHVGEQHLVWCRTARQAGSVVWGRIHEELSARVTALWAFEAQLEVPYASVVDLSGVTGVDAPAFELVARYMTAALPRLATRVGQQALVRPPGMAGALVAGFYPTLSPGFEWRDFADSGSAYAWCAPDAAAEIDALISSAQSTPALIGRLRHHLRTTLVTPTLSSVARDLGVSSRTLQRELQDSNSGFRTEREAARIEAARALLTDSDLKLEAIAQKVGCRSLPTFVTLFRRLTGETPTQYRSRTQSAP